jgi:fatty-acyl-CoA synthase
MDDRHFEFWPRGVPRELAPLETTVCDNLAVAARRFPAKPAIIYYDSIVTYDRLNAEVGRLAGYLAGPLGVARGDRVLLFMQNAPQFVAGYYAILRADAVVVPVNPMSRTEEVRHIAEDAGARIVLCGQELADAVRPLVEAGILGTAIVAAYGDYVTGPTDLPLPAEVAAPARPVEGTGFVAWRDAIDAGIEPGPHLATSDDWCTIPYSSGTTGAPKGCLHTHRSVMASINAYANWNPLPPAAVSLASLPLFHATGMQSAMNLIVFAGATMVIMTRWDRGAAAMLIARHRVSHWRSITTMAIDFLADPDAASHDLSSLTSIGGGGAQMPRAVAERFRALTGLDYVEGYGLSEAIAATHVNPPHRPKLQCLGIPLFGVDSRIVDPETLDELGAGEVGEIVVSGPQLFDGYWNRPDATAEAVFERDGKRFLRTGDLGYRDEEGYYFLVDRLKRMINASGYKVWPAEVEAMLHGHPEIREACVIAAADARRGETVKAVVVARDPARPPAPEDIQAWCRERMASYKVPRIIAIAPSLPRSGSGKVLWRVLQDRENAGGAEGCSI